MQRRGRTPLRRIRRLVSILLQMLIVALLIVAWASPQREAVALQRVPVADERARFMA